MNIVKYEEFRKKNPDFQSRVEAFTGILTPDPKGITLWSMKPGRPYSYRELFEEVCKFSDHDPGSFLLTRSGVWNYCHGDNPAMGREGFLCGIGAVVRLKIKKGGERYFAYQKIDAGRDFGDAIVARGTYLVNKSWNNENKPRYCSLWKILGRATTRDAEVRMGFAVYKITKLLYENPEIEFRLRDIAEETGLDKITIRRVLNSLGKSGVIDYGKWVKGYVIYEVADPSNFLRLDPEEVYQEVRRRTPHFREKGYLLLTINLIKDDLSKQLFKGYNFITVAERVGIPPARARVYLSALSELGYLKSKFKERRKSVAKANEHTEDLWKIVFEPIEKISYTLDPYAYSGFYDILDRYKDNEEERKRAIKNQLRIYNKERTSIGPKGGEELRRLILNVMPIGEEMKLSRIQERVNEIGKREMSSHAIAPHLRKLMKWGYVEKTKHGFYKKTRSLFL